LFFFFFFLNINAGGMQAEYESPARIYATRNECFRSKITSADIHNACEDINRSMIAL